MAGDLPEVKRTSSEVLPCVLTQVEMLETARRRAEASKQRKSLEAAHAVRKEEMKREVATSDGEMEALDQKLLTGLESRSVVVNEYHDHQGKRVFFIREDTGELLRERAMTQKELQLELPCQAEPGEFDPPDFEYPEPEVGGEDDEAEEDEDQAELDEEEDDLFERDEE